MNNTKRNIKKRNIKKTKKNYNKKRNIKKTKKNYNKKRNIKKTKKNYSIIRGGGNDQMEVKMIPIKEWLEHYGLGEYANDLKLSDEIKLTKTDNIYIRTNIDLLDFFASADNFANYIEGIVMIKNAPKTNRNTNPELYDKMDKDIETFIEAYKMLDAQRKDYTKYKFILGPDATQDNYEQFMTKDNLSFQTTYFLSFDEEQKKSSIYKDDPYTLEEILEKMRLLKLDELFDPDLDLEDYMVKDIELIKLANRYLIPTKTIFTGCEPTMTDEEYKNFINNNSIFTMFVSPKNKNSVETMRKTVLEQLPTAEQFLKVSKQDLFEMLVDSPVKDIELIKLANRFLSKNPNSEEKTETIFTGCEPTMTDEEYKNFINNNAIFTMFVSPKNRNSIETMRETVLKHLPTAKEFFKVSKQDLFKMLVDSPRRPPRILLQRMEKILFPSRSQRVFNTLMKRIKEIPNRKNIDFQKNKLRVFIVSGHGTSCNPYFYRMREGKDRVKLSEVIKRSEDLPLPDAGDLTILATQPFGRLSHQTTTSHLINALINEDRESIIRGLLNVQTTEELRLIENFINMWIYKTETGDKFDKTDFEQEYAEYLKTQKYFSESKTTTPERINFVRYSSNYEPPNKEIYFEPSIDKEVALGVYEITTPHVSDLQSILKQINNYLSNDKKIKMGVHEYLYRIRSNKPKNYEEIVKINKELYEKSKDPKNPIKLSDVLESIYANSNIKKGEKVVVLTNQCRGVLLRPNFINTLSPDQKAAFERDDFLFDKATYLTGIDEKLVEVIRKKSGQGNMIKQQQANQQQANQQQANQQQANQQQANQ